MATTARHVHIVPIEREVDRAVLPFLGEGGRPAFHADHVILLVPPSASAQRIAAKVERALHGMAPVERVALAHDPAHPAHGFPLVLQQMAWLLQRETAAGHRVHVNLSSGSKLVAIAMALAAMAHLRPDQGTLYYAQYEGFSLSEAEFEAHGHTRGLAALGRIEMLPVPLPDPVQRLVLEHLRHRQAPTSYRDLLGLLEGTPGSGFVPLQPGTRVRDWNNAGTTRMVRMVLAPLQAQGLVEVVDQGRSRGVRITARGSHVAALGGAPPLGPTARAVAQPRLAA